jgi:hypothetical protein
MKNMVEAISMASISNSSLTTASTLHFQDPFGPSSVNLLILLIIMAILTVSLQFAKGVKSSVPSATTNKNTKTPPKLSALSDFVSHGESILYKESTIHPEEISDAPELIILCTWMSAAHRYIAKYTNTYTTYFPSASQLVVCSTLPDMTWRTHTSQRNRITPAINLLGSILEKNPKTRILLHVFSDGGANTACQLAHELRVLTSKPFLTTAMILDSTPGGGTYKSCRDAIVNSIPRSLFVRFIGIWLTHAYLMTVWTMETFLRVENVRERRMLDLNDSKLFAEQATRLYVYSKVDKIVPWEGVEAHAEAAMSMGLRIERLRFEETSHVGHIQKHAATYWETVQRVWFERKLWV